MTQEVRLGPSDMVTVILLSSLRIDKGKCDAFELVAVACLSWPSSQYPSRTASSFQSWSWAIFDDATSLQPPTNMPHRRGSLDDPLQTLRLTILYLDFPG